MRESYPGVSGVRRGAIGRVVVDEDSLPGESVKSLREACDYESDVVPLIIGGENDRKIRKGASHKGRGKGVGRLSIMAGENGISRSEDGLNDGLSLIFQSLTH